MSFRNDVKCVFASNVHISTHNNYAIVNIKINIKHKIKRNIY